MGISATKRERGGADAGIRLVGHWTRRVAAALGVTLCSLAPRAALADLNTVISPTADGNIYQTVSSRNGGAATELLTGRVGASGGCTTPGAGEPNICGSARRALLRFSTSGIPAGSLVTSAQVRMFYAMGAPESGVSRQVTFRRVTANWVEGTGGGSDVVHATTGAAVPSGGGATWLFSNFGVSSWPGGGAFAVATSASTLVSSSTTTGTMFVWSGPQMTADVRGWLNGSFSNFGWIVSGDETAPLTMRRFVSREGTAGQRPVLVVSYKVPDGAACSPNGTNSNCISGICTGGLCGTVPGPVSATFTASADTNLYSAVSNRNGGRAAELLTGRIASTGACTTSGGSDANICNATRRGVVRFSLSSIPTGSLIVSARVQLSFTLSPEPASISRPVTLRRVTVNWVEGTGGTGDFLASTRGTTAPTGGGATWSFANQGVTAWTAGGSASAAVSATTFVPGGGATGTPFNFTGTQLTTDVQNWITTPATSFGWLITGDESSPMSIRRFASREATTASQRPMLIVTYKLPTGQPCSPNGANNMCISGTCTAGTCN